MIIHNLVHHLLLSEALNTTLAAYSREDPSNMFWGSLWETLPYTDGMIKGNERLVISLLHEYIMLARINELNFLSNIMLMQSFWRRNDTSGVLVTIFQHDSDDGAIYFLKSYFDQWEIGLIDIAQGRIKRLAGVIYRINETEKEMMIWQAFRGEVVRLSEAQIVLTLDIQPYNNLGHMWWNGSNGFIRYLIEFTTCQRARHVIAGYCRPLADYYAVARLASEVENLPQFPSLVDGPVRAVDTVYIPVDTMILSGASTRYYRENISNFTTITEVDERSEHKFLLIFGLKGSERQCTFAQQERIVVTVIKELIKRGCNGRFDIVFTGCVNGLSGLAPSFVTPSSEAQSLHCQLTELYSLYLRREERLFATILHSLERTSLDCKIFFQAGDRIETLSNTYVQSCSAIFVGGSVAQVAAIFGASIILISEDPNFIPIMEEWGDSSQKPLNSEIEFYYLPKGDFQRIDDIATNIGISLQRRID